MPMWMERVDGYVREVPHPYLMWHIIVRKHCPMMKVNSMLVEVATAIPAVRISAG